MGERRADDLFRDQIGHPVQRFDPTDRPGYYMPLGGVLAELLEAARARASGKRPLPPINPLNARNMRKP